MIGRNGANIRKIRELTGARIVFPSDSEANSAKERDIITIVGREESVKKAREELEARIKELVGFALNKKVLVSIHSKTKASLCYHFEMMWTM